MTTDRKTAGGITLKAMVGGGLALFACFAADAGEYTARSYVADGLIVQFDAIENVAYGVHDASSPFWANLRGVARCGHLPLSPLKAWNWTDDALALTAGDSQSDARLVTPEAVNLGNTFTIEVGGRTGDNGVFRRWEVYKFNSVFETWNNEKEGYLERINGTRFAALTKQLANADLAFATTYAAGRHRAYAWTSDGAFHSAEQTGSPYSFNGRLAFFSNAPSGAKARSVRIYDRVLSEDELRANQVIDQMRFFGKTRDTVVLPQGWSFSADGALLNAASEVMVASPREVPSAARARGIAEASFARAGDRLRCTARIEEGTDGVTNALYVAWADADRGDTIAAWPRVERVRLVPPDVTDVAFDVPRAAAAFAQTVHVRLFLTETAYPYDCRISAVRAKNDQYLDSGYHANPRTYVALDCRLYDLTVQQRLFGADEDDAANAFSLSCYINGGGQWAYSCSDGKGNWTSLGRFAYLEPVSVSIDVAKPQSVVITPTHGRVVHGFSSTRTKTATQTLCFFADKRKNDHIDLRVRDGEFHAARIAEGGELLRSWTPCVAGGRAALYDSVSNEVFYSASGTDFLASGTNVSLSVEAGDAVAGTYAVGQLPKDVYEVDTGASPLVVDYSLVYTGGGHKYGASPLTLEHSANDFGGTFTVHEGTLKAAFGAGLAPTDRLVLDGGLWASASALTAPLGTTAGTVQLVAGSRAGFAAYGAPNTVDFGGSGAALVYPSDDFAPSALLLNDAYSTDPVTFNHAIVGDGTQPALEIAVGGAQGVMAKNVTDVGLTKTGAGELLLAGLENRLSAFTSAEGATTAASPQGRMALTFDGAVKLGEGARLTCSNASVAANGTVEVVRSASLVLKDAATVVEETATIGGEGTQTARLVVDGGTFDCRGTLNLGRPFGTWTSNGDLVVTNDAVLTLNRLSAGVGCVYQYSGSVTVTNLNSGDCALGTLNGFTHNYRLYGGTFEYMGTGGNFQTGRAGTNGVSNIYIEREGVLKTHCWSASFGRWRCNTGRLYVRNGGRFIADYTAGDGRALTVWFSDEGSGYLEVASGGSVDIDGRLCCCPAGYTHPERTGEIRLLSGGTVISRAVACETTVCRNTTLIYDGGRVVVRDAPQPVFTELFKTAQIGVAGGVIDTNGSDIRFEQSFTARTGQAWTAPTTAADIDACAAFTKTGAGTLTWLGTNTYACATCVSNGVLATACEAALPPTGILRLAGGAVDLLATRQKVDVLFGTGAVSNGTLSVTGAVWPGGLAGGTLELSGVTADFAALHYTLDEAGRCGTLKTTTPIGLDGVEIVVDGLSNKAPGRLLLVDAPSVTGTPVCDLPRTNRLYVSGGRLYLGSFTGTTISLR